MTGPFEGGKSMVDTAGREQLVSDLWEAVAHLDSVRACLADAAKVLQVGLDREAAVRDAAAKSDAAPA